MTEGCAKGMSMRYSSRMESGGAIREAALLLRRAGSVLLAPHVNIDGDDAGSMIALSEGLESLGVRTVCVSHDPIPQNISFLEGCDRILPGVPPHDGPFDCLVLMECTNPGRLPEGFDPSRLARSVLNLDHHKGNAMPADVSWVDPGAAALGEMVFRLLKEMGAEISPVAANALFLSIMSDTGGFRYSNVSSMTHDIAAELIDLGADSYGCSRKFFLSVPVNLVRLTGRLMSDLSVECGGRLVVSRLSMDMIRGFGVSMKDVHRLAESLNVVSGSVVFCLFTELPDGSFAVSLRSSDPSFNVRMHAMRFGGGGHDAAAGCTIDGAGRIEELLAPIRKELDAFGKN